MVETEDPLEIKSLNCLFLTHIGTAIRSHIGEESLKIFLHPAIIQSFYFGPLYRIAKDKKNEILTDANFKFNRPVYIKHHRGFIKASKQLVFAAAQVWLKRNNVIKASVQMREFTRL